MCDWKGIVIKVDDMHMDMQNESVLRQMGCKIHLFSTLENNPQQFNFQGITRDQLGLEQQLKIFQKTPHHPLPKSILFLPISVTYIGPRGHSNDVHSLKKIKTTMMVIKAPENGYHHNTKLRTVLSFFSVFRVNQ